MKDDSKITSMTVNTTSRKPMKRRRRLTSILATMAVVSTTLLVLTTLLSTTPSSWIQTPPPSKLTRNLANSLEDEHDPTSPKVAWLMSFPAGGASNIQDLIHRFTNTTTANNYGFTLDSNGNVQNSVPVFRLRVKGPFLNNQRPIPRAPSYIATKTHCGNWCFNCYPGRFFSTLTEFHARCLQGARNDPQQDVQYDGGIIQKAVHVVRDPLSNIVGRFKMSVEDSLGDKPYPITPEGFKQYCADMDAKFLAEEQKWYLYNAAIDNALQNVPCRVEFYKYVQWHNDAQTVAAVNQGVPTLVVKYEHLQHNDYNDTDAIMAVFNKTVGDLFGFLQLNRVPQDFYERLQGDENRHLGIEVNDYSGFFTPAEIQAVHDFVKVKADPWLYQELKPDFVRLGVSIP